MISLRSTAAAVALASALLLVAAACGGSDSAATTQAPATQAADTAAADTGGGAAATSETGATLKGTVGPGFTITLTKDGQAVTSLPAGSYEIVVDDQASIHNFHLTGPGVDEATDVNGTGQTTWTVTLEAGTYTFQCDPHASSMNGTFTVS